MKSNTISDEHIRPGLDIERRGVTGRPDRVVARSLNEDAGLLIAVAGLARAPS